jgi:uncharacterized protein YprB with RNaseH-like and TPR domain
MNDTHSLVSKIKELANEVGETPTQQQFIKHFGTTRWKIESNGGWHRLCEMADIKPKGGANQFTKKIESVTRMPRVLFFDIETSPITGYTWGTYEQSVIKILKDWFVLSYAARFKDDERFFYLDQRFSNPIDDDFQLLCGIHHLLSEADICVSHNGARFDHKKLNARFIKHGLQPLNHYRVFDTLKIARKHFAFTSNKLADLAKFLECDIQKSSHQKFPGFSLWDECMKGNQEAFAEMEAYNKTDVDVLIAVFNKLAPWEPSLNFQAFTQKPTCSCGSQSFFKDGQTTTKQGVFHVYRCHDCKATYSGKENLIDKDIRKGFFK